ncbi:MAG: hypothetical protein RIT35_1112 [Pseudomonadota bacterium]|jgi:hypothetical protein
MSEKKNIVIKVKYSADEKKVNDNISDPKLITEWNIKRIALALGGLLFFIVIIFSMTIKNTEKIEPTLQDILPDKVVSRPENNNTDVSNNITRAFLTFKIDNNEPAGKIDIPVKLSKYKSTSLYYFVELTGMKGRTVYHEWLLEGKLITRKKVNISNNNWRTSSRQFFANSDKTNWMVRLVDENNKVINELNFSVIYQ